MNEKTVGKLAKFTGVPVATIKYYEKIGLLSSSRKEKSNYRSYDIRICTDIYECIKYRNMGFPLKEIGELLKEADDTRFQEMLDDRLECLEGQIRDMSLQLERLKEYRQDLDRLEERLGQWYIEEFPSFYFRLQTEGLAYGEDTELESDGINLSHYAPASKSIVVIKREYLKGDLKAFSWGQGMIPRPGDDFLKGKEGFSHVPAGRAFVTYLRMCGPYVSDGRLGEELRRIYSMYSSELPPGDIYGSRLKITHDSEGNDWNYFKIIIPL